MIDFLMVSTRPKKNGIIEIYPKFIIKNPSKHLMIRGGDFYAIWMEDRGLWSTNEQDAIDIIDRELDLYAKENEHRFDANVKVAHMWDAESGMIDCWHRYCQKQMRDSFHMLNEKLIFSNMPVNIADYASKRLPYPLEKGSISAWDTLVGTLYSPQERRKIEWAIGAIVTGESRKIQKFMVFYGSAGTGKSTIINVIQQLFDGYYTTFESKALGSANNVFALEAFRSNPLVAIEHDGDLSRIEDNTRINSLVSHELMTVNEKFKSSYTNRFKAFLIMGTNRPVKITDAKSGLLRRLIDVSPTGKKVEPKEYRKLVKQISFELGAIADHCKDVYLENPDIFDDYIPLSMLGASNDFYNFVQDSWAVFNRENETTLKAAWEMYRTYCDDAKVPFPYSQRIFKEELKNYFWEFKDRDVSKNGTRIRSHYIGFRSDRFEEEAGVKELDENPLNLKNQSSLLDISLSACPAQYANEEGTPMRKWVNVKTTLRDIDTSKTHYVMPPTDMIVIDFDFKDKDGNKDTQRNMEEAAKWPKTYSELSKGGGVHLHYMYDGDVNQLSSVYEEDIEVKVFVGNSSLRRRVSMCNDIPVTKINHGLPLKEVRKTLNFDSIQSERGLRNMILRNLRKEVHADTSSSVNFIYEILEKAYDSGLKYDVSDMEGAITAFAAGSTNQAERCVKLTCQMKFKSADVTEAPIDTSDQPITFFDVEVFPNLFLVNWKYAGENNPIVRMINPGSVEIEELLRHKLVGFNNLRYDNHILYARWMGYTTEQLFKLSTSIINAKKGSFVGFAEAKNLSYTDIYDFAAKKQSLKKWEIELGIHHQELGLPFDQPVPEELWYKVAEYCDNDVIATEAVFNKLEGDFTARKILADIAGMTLNDTTNNLTTRIIFGRERHPKLVYTDLSETFPGYEFKHIEGFNGPQNIYRNTNIGFGGYIVSHPGIYGNVALLDVASLHPNSIRAMNCFGEYTKNFTDILDARVAIKHKDYDSARKMLGGKLAPYLTDKSMAKALSQALKIAINSVYGLTSASFDNPFRDPRNKNNIVALRGALFMRTLQDEVESRGYQIVAIKTDSIKIADATKEIVDFCMEFGKKYGYTFEHEATYDKICQINDADYVARYKDAADCERLYGYVPEANAENSFGWTVTGAQFAVPYVFKTLFTGEKISFDDLCETKSVTTALYLDMNEDFEDVDALEKTYFKLLKKSDADPEELSELEQKIAKGHNYIFVGKVGRFCPIKSGCGGGLLTREKGGKYSSANGAKGYRWLESELVKELGKEGDIDHGYYLKLVDEAKENIAQYGDFEWFVSDDKYDVPPEG